MQLRSDLFVHAQSQHWLEDKDLALRGSSVRAQGEAELVSCDGSIGGSTTWLTFAMK